MFHARNSAHVCIIVRDNLHTLAAIITLHMYALVKLRFLSGGTMFYMFLALKTLLLAVNRRAHAECLPTHAALYFNFYILKIVSILMQYNSNIR